MRAVREILVAERRRIAAAYLALHEANGGGGEAWGVNVATMQTQIEAVDRAISDEENLARSRYQVDLVDQQVYGVVPIDSDVASIL
jgi:hypothetical protein